MHAVELDHAHACAPIKFMVRVALVTLDLRCEKMASVPKQHRSVCKLRVCVCATCGVERVRRGLWR